MGTYYPYYRYYCGDLAYWGGYYFNYGQSVASVDEGIAFLVQSSTYVTKNVTLPDGGTTTQYDSIYKQNLAFLDLRNPANPSVSEVELALPGSGTGPVDSANLVTDGMTSSGLYITYRVRIAYGPYRTDMGAPGNL